mmetsp:Transcript_6144/g.9104  ORF Transcript_6144/g.9104 Transcript_6144/m.9104 type:complete len:121 (+) Transcript_6144:14-376(+)
MTEENEETRSRFPPGVVGVSAHSQVSSLLNLALSTLESEGQVLIRSLGNAAPKAVTLAEMVKKRVPSLHQQSETSTESVSTNYANLQEGQKPANKTLSRLDIILSNNPLNQSHYGYQPPE